MSTLKSNKLKHIVVLLLIIVILIIFYVVSPFALIKEYPNNYRIVEKNVEILEETTSIYTSFDFYKLNGLKEVNIYCNELTNLKLLKNKPSLEKITLTLSDCNGNYNNTILNKLPLMENVTNLTIVSFYGKEIGTDTKWLKSFPNLSNLCIISHDLSDISGLKILTQLERLHINDTSIKSTVALDLGVLKDCSKLSELVIDTSSNNTPNTNNIYQCESIEVLSLTTNNPELDIVNISNMVSIKQLKMDYCGKEYNDYEVIEVKKEEIDFLNNLDSFIYSNFEISDENGNILNLQKNDDYDVAA